MLSPPPAGVRRTRYAAASLIASLVTLSMFAVPSVAGAATPDISIVSPRQYFSPNGDGQEDKATISFCLAESANVTTKVEDSSHHVVRTVEDAKSHPATSAGCPYWGSDSVTWDGQDDDGSVVSDGVYAVRLHAGDSSGHSRDASVEIGVDTRVPGSLTTPSEGHTPSDSANWAIA